ncbi:hypothetical protein [Variovorax saccharolyticus]|uniref:hypothetical protein n=1 Tax=Variovorax saccharolyticus TaxID=3053516 RepID=UPI00257568FD|nr:hypothetical protein [Variovorax sp. J31P216]MDM0027656.1 hypothetical protein [Variovorax sp. J31P216]
MKIYAAGWVLQSPALNFFKRFLHFNDIVLAGIIYPKRIPPDLEGIPVLNFEEAREVLARDDIVLQCALDTEVNKPLLRSFSDFFSELGLVTTSVADFVNGLISDDSGNRLRLPFAGVSSADIKALRQGAEPVFVDGDFFDFESYEVARRLDAVLRSSDWKRMLDFDHDETLESGLLDVISQIHGAGFAGGYKVVDSPRLFLNALIQMRLQDASASFHLELSEAALHELGPRREFYERCFRDCLGGESKGTTLLLSGSADAVIEPAQAGRAQPAICVMKRSLVDHAALKRALGKTAHRVLLRQPDTELSHLISALILG